MSGIHAITLLLPAALPPICGAYHAPPAGGDICNARPTHKKPSWSNWASRLRGGNAP